jgi:hypothetical protein
MSDVRIIRGGALYTSSFYPGTSPLTSTQTIGTTVYGTTMFLNGTSGGVIDATRTLDLETVGDAKITPVSPYNGNYYSNYFDGTNDYLSSPYNAALDMGTGDCTIECWFYITANTPTNTDGNREATLLSTIRSDGGALTQDYSIGISGNATTTGTGITFNQRTAGTNYSLTYTATITQGVWHHVAVSRTGNTLNLLYDGARVAQNTNFTASITTATGGNPLKIGGLAYSAGYPQYLNGSISNVRLIKGTALYTDSTYTVPTSPLTAITNTVVLTCQSNKFIDNSTNAFTITVNGDTKVVTQNPFQVNTGQSYYFDGTGDYLSTPTSPNLDFNTGDFTVEAWVYPNSLSSDWFIASASGSGGFFFGYSSTTTLGYGWGRVGTAWDYRVGSTATTNQWQHVAVTRSGTSMRLFVNGTQQGTTQTISTAYNMGTTSTTIGSQGASYLMTGYISDLRITKGYARYTATFTPSPIAAQTK